MTQNTQHTIHANEEACNGEHVEFRTWLVRNGYTWTAEPMQPHASDETCEANNAAWNKFCAE